MKPSEFWYDDLKRYKPRSESMSNSEEKNSELSTKPTNPKDAVGIKKAYLSTVPCPVLFELGGAMLEGARKYGRHNYRVIGVRSSVYYDAAMRHIMSWWEGEDIDPDSGFPHLVKAMACFTIIRDAAIQGKLTDDRPPPTPRGWIEDSNAQAASIIEKLPNARKPYVNDSSGSFASKPGGVNFKAGELSPPAIDSRGGGKPGPSTVPSWAEYDDLADEARVRAERFEMDLPRSHPSR